jgi:hypothetical protein
MAGTTAVTSAHALLDRSIELLEDSIALQRVAQAMEPGHVVLVQPGDSLPSVLEQLAGGEIVYVSPDVVTACDLTLTKPVRLAGASIIGLVDVQAPDVKMLGCSITGPHPDGTLLSTGDGLMLQGCRLHGSINGQHRGICVRSSNVSIVDTSVTGIYKPGQETQAIAGWSGIKQLRIRRCLLEAAGVNLMFGGCDPENEDCVPEDITITDCYLRKPNEWWGWTNVKNLFEVKNAKRLTFERNFLEYSWVEGQVGYAILLNVRNQEGTAPYSTIEDVVIRNNQIRYTAGGMNVLGSDYTNPSQTMKRVLIEGNTFTNIEPRWGSNQRCLMLAHGGEDITIRGNSFSGEAINSFMTFDAEPLQRLTVEGNTFPEGYYGIKSDDCSLGTPTLEKYAPDCAWSNNTVVRSVPDNNIPYPPGTTVVQG